MNNVHVLRTPGYHVGYVRGIGCRNWRKVTGQHKRAETALAAAVRKMQRDDKRACAVFVPTGETGMYYEPHIEMEASRT